MSARSHTRDKRKAKARGRRRQARIERAIEKQKHKGRRSQQ